MVCDADPAAPAWANAILRANGIKNKTTIQNTISSVAKHMTNGAMFDGIVKNAHPAYETGRIQLHEEHPGPEPGCSGLVHYCPARLGVQHPELPNHSRAGQSSLVGRTVIRNRAIERLSANIGGQRQICGSRPNGARAMWLTV